MSTTIAELALEILKEKVQRARKMSMEEKFFAGRELFESGCMFSRVGIRAQHPDASGEEIESHLQRRLALALKMERSSRKSSQEQSTYVP